MSLWRTLGAIGLLGMAVTAAMSTGCGTNAVGVDDCRKIENARCEAAPHCPSQFAVTDVTACKRFYYDQCLHGFSIDTSPGSPVIAQCVTAIEKLGTCARTASDMPAEQCSGIHSTATTSKTVCELLQTPELMSACAFLVPTTTTTDDAGSADAE